MYWLTGSPSGEWCSVRGFLGAAEGHGIRCCFVRKLRHRFSCYGPIPARGKLDFCRRGPREVLSKHDSLSYMVRNRLTNAVERIHVTRLTQYDGSRTSLSDELGGMLQEGHYIVHHVSGHTYGPAGELYLQVQWSGDAPNSVTWELWSSIKGVVVAQDYFKAHRLRARKLLRSGH